MLTCDIRRNDIAGPWLFHAGAWRSGVSQVRPLAHPALEALRIDADDAILLVVREVSPGSAPPVQAARREAGPGAAAIDRLCVEHLNVQVIGLPRRPGDAVVFAAGQGGTAPLFLQADRGAVRGDWDVAGLYPHVRQVVDLEAVAHCLAHLGLPYSSRTAFGDIHHLTERARARWRPGDDAPKIEYPGPLRRPAARELVPGADVHAAFADLMREVLLSRSPAFGPIATELSGGLDSACLTILLSDAVGRERTLSYGVLLPGAGRAAQARRREEIVRLTGVRDTTIDGLPPFLRGAGERIDPCVPWGEYYRETFFDLSQRVAQDGCPIVVRGIGGDEISELSDAELCRPAAAAAAVPDARPHPSFLTRRAGEALRDGDVAARSAPPTLLAESFYFAAAASTPVYLRRGIWPIYPYGVPHVLRFCLSLPLEWRADRTLQRSYLRARGLPAEVARPAVPETFLPLRDGIFHGASARYLRELFREPVLAECGLVDRDALLEALEIHAEGRGANAEATQLLEAATMETALRTAFRLPVPA